MKKELLDILACPECQFSLEVTVFLERQFKSAEIMEGLLTCKQCVKSFPVIDGIPRFVPNVESLFPDFVKKYPEAFNSSSKDGRRIVERAWPHMGEFLQTHGPTQQRFEFEWMNYPGALPEDKGIFLAETQIPEIEWKGKRVLDAGCGMGRYSRIAHELGSNVVALDLGGALVRLWDLATESDRLHLVQGNLMSPPLRKSAFDVVYSIGVIHHTPSAKETFQKISQLVIRGGKLTLWVYGMAGSFKNFKTNPIRDDRVSLKRYLFLVWIIVMIREAISNTLRLFSVLLPHSLLYRLCYPLALLGKIPLVKYLTFSVHPLWRVRLQENFDWLAPPYQSHHTKEELILWFETNGFEVFKILPHGFVPKPGAVGLKK